MRPDPAPSDGHRCLLGHAVCPHKLEEQHGDRRHRAFSRILVRRIQGRGSVKTGCDSADRTPGQRARRAATANMRCPSSGGGSSNQELELLRFRASSSRSIRDLLDVAASRTRPCSSASSGTQDHRSWMRRARRMPRSADKPHTMITGSAGAGSRAPLLPRSRTARTVPSSFRAPITTTAVLPGRSRNATRTFPVGTGFPETDGGKPPHGGQCRPQGLQAAPERGDQAAPN